MECKTAKQCCRNANNCGWFYGVHSFCLPYCCWWCVVAFFAMTFTWRQLLIESNLKTNNSRKKTKIKCSKEDKENNENILWPVFTAQKEVRPVRHTASVIFLLCSYSFLTTTSCSKQSPNVLSLCWLLLLILRHVCFFRLLLFLHLRNSFLFHGTQTEYLILVIIVLIIICIIVVAVIHKRCIGFAVVWHTTLAMMMVS